MPRTTSTTEQHYGYPFGVDGLMSTAETLEFLGNISADTLERMCQRGEIRKGRAPAGRRVGYCRRSVIEYVRGMEV